MKRIKKMLGVIAFAAIAALPFTGCQPAAEGQAEEEELELEAADMGLYAEEHVKVLEQ
ncbi:MAG: hypothetical protein II837_01700 [Treponema sp.]|nr:hypothetical protein [Treponema sp.]MBQ6566122.1 hypothetical protein [Treponema sp.]MBQ7167151.1 hypothetical protein [Treponema sp.]